MRDFFSKFLDNIYSDWAKLSQTGAKTADSDSGWQFQDQLQPLQLGAQLENAVKRSFYLQLVPQFYQLDAYFEQPVQQPSQIGSFYLTFPYESAIDYNCSAFYSNSLPSEGFGTYIAINDNNHGKTSHDVFVIGGTINDQHTYKVSESLPSQQLLDTLFQASNLNIPSDPFFANNGFLTRRPGPSKSNGYPTCYKIGCVAETVSGYRPISSCIGP